MTLNANPLSPGNLPGNILVADDNPLILQLLGKILRDQGYKVRILQGGGDVLSSVRLDPPDLILLDIQMPDVDGLEICRQLKADPNTETIPVLFVSAFQFVERKLEAFGRGGADYITKPFQREELLARVKTHLNMHQLQVALEQRNRELQSMQRQLEAANAELQSRMREEMEKRRFQEQLLIQQSKMAALGEMSSAIAHQWRQPLNTVGILAQDLIDAMNYGELNQTYLENNVSQIMQQVRFMSQTVEDFRSFFKPAKEIVRFDIRAAIQEIITLLNHQFSHSRISISLEGQCQSAYVLGHPNEFKQVVLILLNNSREAILARYKRGDSTPGKVWVEIEEGDGSICLRFADNGGGILAEIMPRLFAPYISSKGEEGTGIGLYMAKTIIENSMEGSLSAANRKEGAEFVITLPVTNTVEPPLNPVP
jgi:C4-dicarboxylate-specific signal transduction histidine kinase